MNTEQDETTAIFDSAGQAVHVAYLILSEEPGRKSLLLSGLKRFMEELPSLSNEQRQWLDQLRGDRKGTVNFEGLSPLEIRAQCAMVVYAIKTILPKPEMWALQAKYGRTDYEGKDKDRRYAFSAERIAAMQGLSEWLQPSFSRIKPLAMDCLVGRMYAENEKTTISFRDLEQSFGGARMTYSRAFHDMRLKLKTLESLALARLTPHFIEQGVIQDPELATIAK